MHSLKILEETDDHAIIGGYGVVFGGDDLDGEGFEPDTDYMLDLVPVKPVFIDHSEDTFLTADGKTIKLVGINEPVGKVIEVTADDVGLYMKLQLEKAGRYWSVVEQMIGTGKAGLSSGTIGHLARRKGSRIVRWPLVEESITMTPAEPRTVGIERLKHVAGLNPSLKALVTEAAGTAADDDARDEDESLDRRRTRITEAFLAEYPSPRTGEYVDWWVIEVYEGHVIARLDTAYWRVGYSMNGRAVEFASRDTWAQVEERREWVDVVKTFRAKSRKSIVITEKDEMSGENQTQAAADPRDVEIKALSDRVNQMMELLEKSPALKSAGYTTDDGGAADPGHKSFGDFLLAIKRGDTKRLQTVYGTTKDMAEAAGASGGYLVPTEHANQLLQAAEAASPIYARVMKQPVQSDAGEYPALDQFTAPTAGAGNTAWAGGVVATAKAEGATLAETQPTFVNLEWRLHKMGGFVEVSNELIADSPISIEALLRNLFGTAVSARNERNILRGSGVGEPLGILNADCTIAVTTATNDVFAYADALGMLARFKEMRGPTVWIASQTLIPDIGVLSVASGSPVVWAGNLAAGLPSTLLGYPILFSQHMPVANTDDIILADLGSYVMFEKGGLSIAYSEHAAFTADKGTWRFTVRNDGMPWLKNAITLADPGGATTVSPFVYHND